MRSSDLTVEVETFTTWYDEHARTLLRLSPALRAAILDALAHAPNAAADHTPRRYAGHDVYLVQETVGENVTGLAVDTASGRIVGFYGAISDAGSDHPEYAVVASACQRP